MVAPARTRAGRCRGRRASRRCRWRRPPRPGPSASGRAGAPCPTPTTSRSGPQGLGHHRPLVGPRRSGRRGRRAAASPTWWGGSGRARPARPPAAASGTSRSRSENDRSDRIPHEPSRRWRWSRLAASRSVWRAASSAGVFIGRAPRRAGDVDGHPARERPAACAMPAPSSRRARSALRSATSDESMGVGRGGERDAACDEPRQQRRGGIGLGHGLAPPRRRDLGRHARRARRLDESVPDTPRARAGR